MEESLLPCLLLQKPSPQSKAKLHVEKLEHRLSLWKEGNIEDILLESRLIQKHLKNFKSRTPEDSARCFAKLMWHGKISAALKMLSKDYDNGILKVDDNVMNELKLNHPEPAEIKEECLLYGPINKTPNSYFDEIDKQMIAKATRLTKGSGGPSQLDAEQYRHIILSTNFKKESKELREKVAILAKRLATTMVDPSSIEALTACRLIPLNKNPGIRPIGIGEVLRRIIGKSITWVLRDEIQEAAGPLQVATGLNAGAEAAIHAMRTIFAQDSTEAVILVDASNAFNSLNRRVALHNIQITCPPFSTIMINTYRQPSRMIVLGASDISSAEGTTQGDNLAMPFYALGTSMLLYQLRQTTPNVKQIWLADDATGAGTIQQLKEWWDTVIDLGNKFGYYVNQLKSWIIVKNDKDLEKAKAIFENDGIDFTKDCKRHLGAAIGSDQFKAYYASKKVDEWCDEIEVLSSFAKSQPQAAYAAFCHGQQHKFSYFMRTMSGMEKFLLPLDEKIYNTFLPSVLNETITEKEREVYSLPVRLGGLGIPIISEKAKKELAASLEITAPLTDIIISQENKLPDVASVNLIRANVDNRNKELLASKVKHIEGKSTPEINRAIDQASEKGASSWLNVIPLEENDFNLTKGEFRDAISIRYNKRLQSSV